MKTAHLTLVLGALTLSGAALACGGEDAGGDAPSGAMARAWRPANGAAGKPDPGEAGRPGSSAQDGARVARAEKGPAGGRARTASRRGA